jgi:hypothetical protein
VKQDSAAKKDQAGNKITKALAKKEGRIPAKWKPDRIEASQAGNGPLSVTRESGHRLDGRLNAISADEQEQFTAV